MTKPTKPAGFALSNPVPQTKWEAQRNAERITLKDHQTIPHLNSTMGLLFTAISVVRSYIIRRWFNAMLQRAAQRMAKAVA